MSESVHTNTSLWSKGMKAVIVAQFLSAFGDNALLFATLALLKAQFYPECQFCCAVEIYLRMRLAVRQFFSRGEGIETVA